MAADEGRRMRERHGEFLRDRILVLGSLDERLQVVADDLGHAGRRHRYHLRPIERIGVGEPVDHVGEAAEHSGVLGHRRGNCAARLLEMTGKVRAVVGDAPCEPWTKLSVLSNPAAANTAPSGWQALAGLTTSASRARFFSRYSQLLVCSPCSATAASPTPQSSVAFLRANIS